MQNTSTQSLRWILPFCAKCGNAVTDTDPVCDSCSADLTAPFATTVFQHVQKAFVPPEKIANERILWSRDLKRGLVHKQVIVQERITNLRVFQYNVLRQKLVSQVMWKTNPDVLVANSRRRSQSYGYGMYGGGMLYLPRTGTSHSIGDIVIMKDGRIYTRLRNVADPQGVKQLINTLKRELVVGQKPSPRQVVVSTVGKASTASGIACKNCGVQLSIGSNFCNKCGAVQN